MNEEGLYSATSGLKYKGGNNVGQAEISNFLENKV